MSGRYDRVGELFMAGYAGTDPAAADELIRRYHVGGIILFTRNVKNADHAAQVCASLQELRKDVSDTPLFIAIDQEGGCVARITEGVTVFPGNMALGATASEDYAQRAGEVMGAELASMGINVNFAPVLDLGSNPRNPGVGARSFGSDAGSAAQLGAAMIEGMQAHGIHATAKHFPGLGEALVDSHDELPVVHAPADTLKNREFLPFKSAIDSNVSFVMTAHCAFPTLDATLAPGTLSNPILQGNLRNRLGFNGIIITDCLEMLSIENTLPAPEASLAAIRAGATMPLICHTRAKQTAAIEALAKALDRGDIPGETIDEANATVSSIKNRLSLPTCSASRLNPHRSLSETIAAEAITIVKDEDALLPLRFDTSEKLAVIAPAFDALTKVEEAAEPHEALKNELLRRHAQIHYEKFSVEPSPARIAECRAGCRDSSVLLILTYNLYRYPPQAEMVRIMLDLGKPAVVAAVRDPYDLALIEGASAPLALVATYGFRECSLKALVRTLFGEIEAGGRLPIDLDPAEDI